MNKTQTSIDALNRTLPTVSPINLPKILEENVGNFCPVCGKTIFSNLLEIDGKVYLEKKCCSQELIHLENDVGFFKKSKEYTEVEPAVPNAKNYNEWQSGNVNCGTSAYALHITNRCNQGCPVCYMKFSNCPQGGFEASIEELEKELKKYHSRDIILLGGEPTIREDLFEMIEVIKRSGNIPGIYTNGLKLQNKNYLNKLKRAGLKYINLQFDGFNRTANIRLRGQDNLDIQLKVLKNIKDLGGLKVAIVPIIEKDVNEAEISKIIQFARKNDFIDKVTIMGLTPPPCGSWTKTTCSDLTKIMEKEGYFNQEYFLELMRMYRDIYKVTKKITKGTLLENWFSEKLTGAFNVVHFKKETGFPELLFQKKEIDEINKILSKALSKKSRVASLDILIKNSKELIKSPLTILFGQKFHILNLSEKFFFIKRRTSHSNKLLEVGFQELVGPKNTLLKHPRATGVLVLFLSVPLLAQPTTWT